MYKCVIVGVGGGRADGHAQAYPLIRRGKLVAVSTRTPEKLEAFARKYEIPGRYTDYREMFHREKPDLVQVNTPPSVRAEILAAADEAGVPAVIFEKPIAIEGEDYRILCQLAGRVKTKVAVNHQLHFHPNRFQLQQRVADGGIGEVRFIDASARLNLVAQGTHMLQGISAFNPVGRPTSVMAQAEGAKGLQPSPRCHYAPDETLAAVSYDNNVRALLRCGAGATVVTEARPVDKLSLHKRISVYGTAGSAHWTMWSWQYTGRNGVLEQGEHDYFEQDVRAQAALTEAMFDWLEDDRKVHPLNLASALVDFNIILGAFHSVLKRQVVSLPVEPEDGLIRKLSAVLGS
jgi:predicted dehydrogenase